MRRLTGEAFASSAIAVTGKMAYDTMLAFRYSIFSSTFSALVLPEYNSIDLL